MRQHLYWFVALIVLLLTGFFIREASELKFNYEIKRFFPLDNPEISYYTEHIARFTTDNDFSLIAIFPEKGQDVFDTVFLQKAEDLEKEILRIPFVKSTVSLNSLQRYVVGPTGPYPIPILHRNNPQTLQKDILRLKASSHLGNSLVAADNSSLMLVVQNRENLSKARCDTLLNALNETLQNSGISNYKLAGRIPAQAYYIKNLVREFIFYTVLAFLLVLIILSVLFRNIWGVILPVIVITLATVWTLGFAHFIHKPIDPFTSLLPMIIFVVGASDIIHIFSRYIEALREGLDKKTALILSMKKIGLATFLTSLTTSVGFLTLYTNPIEPIRSFGILAATGVAFAYILTILFFPFILWFAPIPKHAIQHNSHKGWERLIEFVSNIVRTRRKAIGITTFTIIILAVIFSTKIRINNLLLDDLSSGDPLKLTFQYFDKNYGGVRPVEFGISVRNGKKITDYDVLLETEMVVKKVASLYQIKQLQSPTEPYKIMNMAFNGANHNFYRLPDTEEEFNTIVHHADKLIKSKKFEYLRSKEKDFGRIKGMMEDLGSADIYPKHDSLQKYLVKKQFRHIDVRITGTAFLIDESNRYISENLLQGLFIAILIVALIAGTLFFDFRIVVITILVNLIPLLVASGLMGIFGIELKVSTAIIFTIAFGIAVDDTLHFLTRLKKEMQDLSYHDAVFKTIRSTGKAIILTTVVLMSGFLVLVFSSFASTFYIGLLISSILLTAVLCDLFLLPALLLTIKYK